jgi:Zn-dependent metalloprotease
MSTTSTPRRTHRHTPRHTPCSIAPPDLLARIAREGSAEQRDAALAALAASASMRTQRSLLSRMRLELGADTANTFAGLSGTASPTRRQTVYDNGAQGRSGLPGRRVRGEDDPPVDDPSVNSAYDGTAATYDLLEQVFGRDSLDGQGMELISSVHYGVDFDNAFWNGAQMVYGDGSGQLFVKGALVQAMDVVGHELFHGVTSFTADLTYSKQSGALNEHFSDVFGSLVKQRHLDQTVDEADWLIGAGTLVPSMGKALRSMSAPGTAYDGDSQPADMAHYVDLPDDNDPRNDNGGVHTNSGIPNRAFYLVATALGGHAWETAGQIWYRTVTERLSSLAQFSDAAQQTVDVASSFGDTERAAVEKAWREVGVLT